VDMSSFLLTVIPPDTSPGCGSNYSLTVRQERDVVYSGSFNNESLVDGSIDLRSVTGNSLAVSTCQFEYSFEWGAERGS